MRRAVVAVAVALGILTGCASTPTAPRTPARPTAVASASDPALVAARKAAGIADCPASDLTIPALTGGLPALVLDCLGSDARVNLAGLRGTPMVVNLWAQWCPPCRAEAPFLREASQRLGDRVLFLGVDYDDPKPDWALEFAGLVGWRYPHVVDPTRSLAGPLRVQGIPVTVFVDAGGTVVYRHTGPVSSTAELEGLIARYLGVSA